jgi:hypothetical protein
VLTEAEGVITMLWEPGAGDPRNLALNRDVALARSLLFRAVRAAGGADRALRAGRLAVESGRMLLDLLPPDDPDRPAVTAQAALTAAELADLAFAAGLGAEASALLEDAAAWCVGQRDPAVRQAFGTVLYERGTAMFDTAVQSLRAGQLSDQLLIELVRTAAHVVLVRRDLRDPQEPRTCAELARALLLQAQAQTLDGDLERSAGQLAEATVELRRVVPPPPDLAERLAVHAALLQRQVPQVTERYRALSQWPI